MIVTEEKEEWEKKTVKVEKDKWLELKSRAMKKDKYTYELLDEVLEDYL